MLTISLVIPVLNAERTLVLCLNALEQLNPQPLEIILVDNGSTDGTLPLAKQFQARVANCLILHEPKRGASAARNAGIHAARGDIVAFTDGDCAPRRDWLEHVLQPFAEARVGAVAGKIVGATSTSLLELFSALYTLQSSDVPTVHERWTPWAGGFPTANLSARRLLLEQLGGFDEDVTIYGEDYDLCARLYEAGSRIAFTPHASVVHHHRSTLTGLMTQAFGFGRSHAYLMQRHRVPGVWLELPRRAVRWRTIAVSMWIDCASPDKKLATLFTAGLLHRSLLVLAPLYGAWLIWDTRRRAIACGAHPPFTHSARLASLLLLKSCSMTLGRWWGSCRYGAVCI